MGEEEEVGYLFKTVYYCDVFNLGDFMECDRENVGIENFTPYSYVILFAQPIND